VNHVPDLVIVRSFQKRPNTRIKPWVGGAKATISETRTSRLLAGDRDKYNKNLYFKIYKRNSIKTVTFLKVSSLSKNL
jgi:hypothetical protein